MNPPANEPWEEDPFQVLGISPDAEAGEIREAYFALVKERSPEKDPEEFKRIRKAYEAVRTDSGRWRSNLMIFEAEKGGPATPLPTPDPITPEEILEDLLLQEEIALGLRG